jgi:hypothetical protein
LVGHMYSCDKSKPISIDLRQKPCIHRDQGNFKDTVSYRSPRKFEIGASQKEGGTDRSSFEADRSLTFKEAASSIQG